MSNKSIKHFYFIFLLAFSFIIWANDISAQSFAIKANRIINSDFKDADGPGGVFLISMNGKPIYQRSVGKANLELNSDLNADNVFQIGSMTKQFTAIAVLMLEEQGKLKVTDPVSKFIPNFPGGNNITVHHLLTHTSGIKDFTKMKSLNEIAQKEMSPEMMVNFFKDEPVDFQPGEKFDYNNSGYFLLGYIIEAVSGTTYENFIEKNIFDKIGMKHSYYASDRQIIRNRASGYHKKTDGYVNKTIISYSIPFSSGSLMSTAGDLLKWQNSISHNRLLTKINTEKAFSKYKSNSGEEFTYGYGWHIKEINSVKTYEHGGSIFGFKTMAVYIPSKDIYVVGLTNCDCNSPTRTVKELAALALMTLKK